MTFAARTMFGHQAALPAVALRPGLNGHTPRGAAVDIAITPPAAVSVTQTGAEQ
jgi:hypothetical protein